MRLTFLLVVGAVFIGGCKASKSNADRGAGHWEVIPVTNGDISSTMLLNKDTGDTWTTSSDTWYPMKRAAKPARE